MRRRTDDELRQECKKAIILLKDCRQRRNPLKSWRMFIIDALFRPPRLSSRRRLPLAKPPMS
jgi:hypothetical protein